MTFTMTFPTDLEAENHRLRGENQALQTGYDASRLEVESLQHRVQELEVKLTHATESRKAAQNESEDLKSRIARGDIKQKIMQLTQENSDLKARVDEVGRIARENRSRAIVDLEVQISKLQFAIECYEKDIAAIKAALPADKYPGSKDWREGCTLERIQWLHGMYACAKEEGERLAADVLSLQAMLDAVGAGGVEPLRKSGGLHQIAEPQPAPVCQPLDDKRIYELYCNAMRGYWVESFHYWRLKERNQAREFVRAVEAAHGITTQAADHIVDANKTSDAPSRWLITV